MSGEKTPASVRLIPASPNSLSPRVDDTDVVPDIGGVLRSVTVVPVFTFASANPRFVRFTASPQHGGELASTSHGLDRKSTRLKSSHLGISYVVLCLI